MATISNVIRINEGVNGNQTQPDIAAIPGGGIFVSYSDGRQQPTESSQSAVLGRLGEFSGTGALTFGTATRLASNPEGDQSDPDVVFIDGDEFLVQYSAEPLFTGDSYNLVVGSGKIEPTGNIELGGYNGIEGLVTDSQIVVFDDAPSPEAGLSWMPRLAVNYKPIEIGSGTLTLGDEFILGQPPARSPEYDIKYLQNGQAIVVYESSDYYSTLQTRVADFDGNTLTGLGPEGVVAPQIFGGDEDTLASSRTQSNPHVTDTRDGWIVYGYNGYEVDSFPDGGIIYTTARVVDGQIDFVAVDSAVSDPAYDTELIDVVDTSDGSVVFVYTKSLSGGRDDFSLFAQRGIIGADGTMAFGDAILVAEDGDSGFIRDFDVEALGEGKVGIAYANNALEADDFQGYGAYMRVIDFGSSPGQNIIGDADGDRLEGAGGDDSIEGLAGDDGILGRAGNDTLDGGPGNDNISAAGGNDLVIGGGGDDNLGGGPGGDTLQGQVGNDTLGGGDGNDRLNGGDGDDVAAGGGGDDRVNGGLGSDTIGASFGDDTVLGQDGADSLGGGTGMDSLSGGAGSDSIGGGEGNDIIDGGTEADFLAGGGRNDIINGRAGNDTINGGNGDDTLTGGSGNDIFVFRDFKGGDSDQITDFADGLDRITIIGQGGFRSLSIESSSDGAIVGVAGTTISIDGIDPVDLGVDDFTFL